MSLLAITADTFKTIGIVAGIFAGIALVLVILILVVGKVFKVDVDEKVTKILENLAGANCGGCGCSGCSGFANKLANGEGDLSACHVTSPEKKAEIAKLLGIELADEEPTVAVVKCNGTNDASAAKYRYIGTPTCAGNQGMGGSKSCSFGCLGSGDCKAVCPEYAIAIENGLSHIDPDKCVSCGSCINTCPRRIIERIPASAPVYVACSNQCKGKEVMNVCKAGCIACGMCARVCPEKAITMVNNLPVFDYKKCVGCMTCVSKCPRKVILKHYPEENVETEQPAAPAKETVKPAPSNPEARA
jgi:Na+-translocating ferredoxin:NAD+ oxidoreductase RNF subunit RnfB